MDTIDKVAWIHIVDGRALCARSHGKDLYYFPGGKRDPGESDVACLARELGEELGVALDVDSVVHLASFEGPADGKPATTRLRMACYTGRVAGEVRAAAEIAELAWLGYADRARSSAMGQTVIAWLHARGLVA